MKYAVAAVVLAAIARAQTLADIPACALPCLDTAIAENSDCATTDIPCVCEHFDDIRGSATTCVLDACGPDVALNEVLPATEALCANAGDGGAESSAPAPSSSAAPETSAAESTSVVETTSVAVTTSAEITTAPAPTTVETSTVVVPTNGSVPVPSTTGPAPTPEPSVPAGGAVALGSMGGLAMLFLAALAL